MLQFSRPVIKNKNNNSDSQEDWKRAFSEQDLTRGSPEVFESHPMEGLWTLVWNYICLEIIAANKIQAGLWGMWHCSFAPLGTSKRPTVKSPTKRLKVPKKFFKFRNCIQHIISALNKHQLVVFGQCLVMVEKYSQLYLLHTEHCWFMLRCSRKRETRRGQTGIVQVGTPRVGCSGVVWRSELLRNKSNICLFCDIDVSLCTGCDLCCYSCIHCFSQV